MANMTIGIDISGGDNAPSAILSGALLAIAELPEDTSISLIGNEAEILPFIENQSAQYKSRFKVVHAPSAIGMGEHPTKAFASKQDSSIAIGFNLLAEGQIDAFASAGNSGAMLVGAHYTIKMIVGVIRPCIASVLPKEDGSVGIILDVGINADCKPETLQQFAVMGALYAEMVCGISNPKVGLLNIGEEEGKGNVLAQSTYPLLKASPEFNFIGNIEGRDLFNQKADVIVCDGFTGNVVLKEAESFYRMIKKRGISDPYFDRFNYENYGGTPIIGVNGSVVIGHGISNDIAIKNMLLHSHEVAKSNLAEKVKKAFQV
ncbi:MAG: glycerol-3-phosphate acyltransferase PlsX [Flavobacteriales bacterium]|jgi:glycerol-3-phosphate acyltransferase PlsX